MRPKKAAPPHSSVGAPGETASKSQANNTTSPVKVQEQEPSNPALTRQAFALWAILRSEGKMDTLRARQHGINHPAGRVSDLRNIGVEIETHWTDAISQTGRITRVALYVLKRNPQPSLFDTPQQQEKEV